MSILLYFFLTVHVIVSLLLVLVVLMQRPRSEGLGAAFGGGMTDNLFGAQTTNVLAKFTTWLGSLFFILTLVLAVLYAHLQSGSSKIQRELMEMPEPVAAKTAAPAPAPKTETSTPDTQQTPATPNAAADPAPSEPVPATPAPAPAGSQTTPAPAADQPAAQNPQAAPAAETSPAN